ncbi:MAG: DUF2029 domain-containing protein [Bacteroidia bacterium]|nr:DUF2029 domain-containing protein [Bacteroidia bacterium]
MKILSETFNFSKKNVWYYLILIGALIIILFEANTGNDFDIYISAASDLFHNKNIYLTTYNDGYHYYYSVLFALLLIPFTFIPIYIVKVIWLLLNIFFVYRLWQIITGLLPYSFSKKIKTLFTIVSFIFILRFLRDNFHLAQVTIFLLYLSMEGLHQIFKGRKLSGSALIALGINIKLMPILLIPYLFYRNEIKAGIYTIIIYIFFFFIPVLCIGWKNNIALLTEWWNLVNPVNTTNIVDAEERSFHSLSTLLSVYLLDDPGDKHALHVKRNIINVSYNTLFILLTISRIALLLLFLYFLRTLPFKKPRSSLHILYETGYIFLITPLIFPHQQHYAFFFLFSSVIYLFYTLFFIFLIADKKIILLLCSEQMISINAVIPNEVRNLCTNSLRSF